MVSGQKTIKLLNSDIRERERERVTALKLIHTFTEQTDMLMIFRRGVDKVGGLD